MEDQFINYLKQKYPRGNEKLEQQLNTLKRKLDVLNNEFSDCDEDELNASAEEIEKKIKEDSFVCERCNKFHKRKKTNVRHMKKHNEESNKIQNQQFICSHCRIPFQDYDSLFHHVTAVHPLNTPQTGGGESSNTNINQNDMSGINVPNDHTYFKRNPNGITNERGKTTKSALKGTANSIIIHPHDDEKFDLLKFYTDVKPTVLNEIQSKKENLRDIKFYFNTRVEMIRDLENGTRESIKPYFRSKTYTSLQNETNDENYANEGFQKMHQGMEEFVHKGSSWRMNKVTELEINIVKYSPLSGSSYMHLPARIRANKGILNIKNQDEKCFVWSILAALHPISRNSERVNHYLKYEHELNMKNIEFPVSLSKIEKFEKQNPDISVNIFGFENEIFPLYLSKSIQATKEVDLLYLKDGEESHYCCIKNLNTFLHITKSKNNRRGYHFCRRCLHGFIRKDLLQTHYAYCKQIDFQRVSYPEEGKNDILRFTEHEKQLRVGFTIYADFECLAKKISSCKPDSTISSSNAETEFEACGYAYQVVCSNDKYTKPPVIFRGENAAEHFLDNLFKEETYVCEILNQSEPLIMNEKTEKIFQKSTHCYVCQQPFGTNVTKCRDHEHLGYNADVNLPTYSNFRGASCQSCNLKLKQPRFIPVVLHNGKNFDYHLLCQAVGKYKNKKISVIATSMEKFISFSIGNLRFIDSFQFMSSSLDTLVKNLSADGFENFKQFRKSFPNDETCKLLLRKNVYCYDYIDSFEKFGETELPPKEAFFNSLKNEHVSDIDYAHAQTVWETFSMENLGIFHDLYVLTDTLLLADVFEHFRDMSIAYYNLDPCHFFTSPGLAWSAALKMTNVNLELLTDPIMYNMFELSMRGGVSMICKKYAKANNPYLPKSYDPHKPNSYLMYLDANNLYGFSMQQSLPTGLMRWLEQDEIEQFDVMKIPLNSDKGYYLDVDLIYPPDLHTDHNCYPLAPIHKHLTSEDISPENKEIWTKHHGKRKIPKSMKLIPTLENKSNYILHYENLQLYLQLGLKLTKINRILEFHQCAWLKSYIDFNTEKRKVAKNEFEKDFFKLMCNAVYGKTMESIRNRVDIKLAQTQQNFMKYVAKPSFQRFQIVNEDLVTVENKKVDVFLNRPSYVGAVILEKSKNVMYKFHYNVMKPKYGDNIKLCFTDTDSLLYEVYCQDFYKDMMHHKHLFDLSNYEKDHFLFDETNKKRPGMFKDETAGKPISEFVGLKAKCYSMSIGEENIEKKTCKGIVKSVINQNLTLENYKTCLFNDILQRNEMNIIKSENHKLYMNHLVKNSLSSYDDKRYSLQNSFETLAYGHYLIQ